MRKSQRRQRRPERLASKSRSEHIPQVIACVGGIILYYALGAASLHNISRTYFTTPLCALPA